MYGRITCYCITNKQYFTFTFTSPYLLERKLKGLRKRKNIRIVSVEQEWN